MIYKQYIFILLFGLQFHLGYSQCITPSFNLPASTCLSQNIKLTPGSVLNNYQWDFCAGDLDLAPSASIFLSSDGPPSKVELAEQNGEYYGFYTSRATGKLFRLDFGTNVNGNPLPIDLGGLGVNSNNWYAIEIVEEGGLYYGFIVDLSNKLYRISFGTSLTNQPSNAEVLYQNGLLASPVDLVMLQDGAAKYAFVANISNSRLVKLAFNSSFGELSSSITVTDLAVTGSGGISGLSFIQECSTWYAITTSIAGGQITKMKFNAGLNDPSPAISLVTGLPFAVLSPGGVSVEFENNKYYAFIQSSQSVSDLYKIDFGGSMSNAPSSASANLGNLGKLNNIFGFAMYKVKSDWLVLSSENSGQHIYRIAFPNNCFSTIQYSTNAENFLATVNPGSYFIQLSTLDAFGKTSSVSKSIVISSNQSPDITFASQNSCVNNIVSFTPQNTSGNITGYAWDFGDTNTSVQPISSNTYSTVGTYPVTLQVTASDGCANTAKSDIDIYNQPIADFALPSASPFCTNQNYVFTNQSTFDAASNPTWEWRLNGTLVAGTPNLTQAFTSTTQQEIRLKAKIPGCENEIIKSVSTVLPGPLTDFTFVNGCQATSVPFANTTSGTVTTYSWNFGDGNTSPSTNTSNVYTNIGPYSVTLQANNAAGCQNSLTKQITIYSKPQPDFSIGLPPFSCSGSSSQFTDLTPSPTDSNIASYAWNFGDAANGTSIFKNPTYTYSTANSYNVSLSVTTNFGCTNSIQKSVTIAQSPLAGFSNLPACVNQATQFTDASTGNIKSRLWQIQGSTFITPNPPFTFPASGTFPVVLTVTGNNNCVAQVNKSINVPIPPSLDFSVQAPCANMNTIFTEITNATDPSISQAWAFGSQANGSGSPAQYSFSTPSNYSVRLSSTRQSGCVYSISKNVSIVNAPVADFLPSVDAGAAPLSVSFTNNSTFANSYQWKFGDKNSSTSLQVNPSFVFSDLGDFNVELAASNTVGCTSKSIKIISVVVPRIDMIMSDFFFTKDNVNALQPVVTVVNKSNVSVTDPIILVDVAGGSSVKKKIIGTLKPNQELTQVLDFQIVPGSIAYICAEVEVTGDTDLFQNRRCLSLQGSEVIFAPFPNPAQAELNLDWINVEGGTVSFQIFNSKGSVCLEQSFSNLVQGINRLTVNTSSLSPGVYVIRFSDSKITQSHKFAIASN
jgi:PKD repeat protein